MQEVQTRLALENEPVLAPFARSEVVLRPRRGEGSLAWTLLAIISGLFGVGTLVAGSILFARYANDPYRALEPFSTSKYLTSYQGLAGAKYRATVRVEADLGWKEGTGRLMLFSDTDDTRPFAVIIPPTAAQGVYFTKGQVYRMELEVKEGGLIYADSCEKD